MKIRFTLNNNPEAVDTDPMRRLLDVLRDDFGLSGVKEGCGEGECGACSVLVNGEIVFSCITPVQTVEGSEILTIEGYRNTDRYRAIEAAMEKAGGVQCGFCTPGFVLAAEALLRKNPHPTEEEIREGISGNLCRCTGYTGIVEGIRAAAAGSEGLW
jgi:carbon-monoxide dehydrogenase small subunit